MTALAPDRPDQHTPEPVIVVSHLTKRYDRETDAIRDLNLAIPCGCVVCVIGPNGAGKTTLIDLLAGQLFPTQGDVRVFGMDRWKQNFEIRKRSTILSYGTSFGACPTPYEYLRFLAEIYGLPKAEFLERLRRLGDDMAMTAQLNKEHYKLSLGMRKKIGLIGCFLPDVELRIMDEPFAGGIDPTGMEALYSWMRSARDRGETVIFSTQVLDQAEQAADLIAVLDNGILRAFCSPAELLDRMQIDPNHPRALAQAFIGLTKSGSDS